MIKSNLKVLAVIFVFLFTGVVFAETSIKAEIDKTKITSDETFTYKITVASSEKRVPEPTLPKFENFIVLSSAQSSTISVSRGTVKTVLVYVYVLAAKEPGKFKIEPAQIKIGGRILASEEVEIEVTQGKTKFRPQPRQKPSQPEKVSPEAEQIIL